MGLETLLLQQQMGETQRNLRKVQEAEQKRREKGGFWSGTLGGVGGLLGGLAGAALAPVTGGLSLALATGAGAGLGSLFGSRVGADLGGGREHDAVNIGQNVDAITGKKKEFSDTVKDRYRQSISDFQDTLNTNILSQAINTAGKAAVMAYTTPMLKSEVSSGIGKAKANLGMGTGQAMPTPPAANIAGAQAYRQASSISKAAQSFKGQLPTGMAPQASVGSQVGGGALWRNQSPNSLLNLVSVPQGSTSVNLNPYAASVVSSPVPSAGGRYVSNIFNPYTQPMQGVGGQMTHNQLIPQ